MEEIPEKPKRSYEKQNENIKKYLKNRYETDAEYRNKVNKRKGEKCKILYNTDEEYRKKHLAKVKEYNLRKKQENQLKLIEDFENDMRKSNNIDDMKILIKTYDRIKKGNPEYIYEK
jgi:hypothetical protein